MRATHKNEERVDIVRVVGDHIFIVAQDPLLNKVPAFESSAILSRVRDERLRLQQVPAQTRTFSVSSLLLFLIPPINGIVVRVYVNW